VDLPAHPSPTCCAHPILTQTNWGIRAFVHAYTITYSAGPSPVWDVSREDWHRFAFLRDRILNVVISQALYSRPGMVLNKGRMTRGLNGTVSNGALESILVKKGISVDSLIPASVDVRKKRGRRITGTGFEALVGGLYCEGVLTVSRSLLARSLPMRSGGLTMI